ncbi:hypothetical protein [Sporisorium scitamineum]|uniref:Uncharacterized protein n=1 Tax=Sporisorium scitamineum TaxID=49012 RepID=A0A0F7S1L3_9BASI|nr:hypothetical protein [Sporisorium scitamineum]
MCYSPATAATLSEHGQLLESDCQVMEEKLPFLTVSASFESLAPSASTTPTAMHYLATTLQHRTSQAFHTSSESHHHHARCNHSSTLGGQPGIEPETSVLATNANVQEDATTLYMAQVLAPSGVKVTHLASGIPLGGELEYHDGTTLGHVLSEQRAFVAEG